MAFDWITNNYIEIFGAVTGILYVFLEIRQNIWLWPVGIVTSAAYIVIFFTSRLYADMSLQCYYLVISVIGWYWWTRRERGRKGESEKEREPQTLPSPEGPDSYREGVGYSESKLQVSHLKLKTGLILLVICILMNFVIYQILSRFIDSPVPFWDSFITSLSVIATWMLARKIYEHWYLWIIVNSVSSVLFLARGLYPTLILYIIYGILSVTGLVEWKKKLRMA